ncbi:MAG: hypothetical protein Q8L48_42785 [Archangium sp.]|nr:hypothetical protein [Archangium sp.]
MNDLPRAALAPYEPRMGQRRILWSLLVLLAACETRPPAPGSASQQAALTTATLGGLIRKTPLVAHVKVVSATGRPGTIGTQQTEAFFTDLTLQVLTSIHGAADSLLLTTLGGRVGARELHVSGQVVLEAGDEAIVFVDPAVSLHPFVGGQGGVLPVKEGRVYAFDGRPLVEVRSEGFVFGRAPGAPALAPALEPRGTAAAARVLPPEGAALTLVEVMAALKALP